MVARKRTPSWSRDDGGQSLVLVVISMVLIVVLAAFAIDAANWFVTRHKAQVTADAMALAAANYMASNAATSSTAAADATSLAQSATYADGSGLNPTGASVSVDTSNYTVTATVTASGSVQFASAAGIGAPTIKATAVASYITGLTPYALFAKDSAGDCSSGITFGNKGGGGSNNDTITGGVHSNGSLFGGLGGTSTVGAISYGCPTSGTTSGNQLSSNGNTTVSVPPIQTSTTVNWPVPYDDSSCALPDGASCYFNPSSSCTYTAGSGTPPANVTVSYSNSEKAYDITITGNIGSSGSYQVLCAPGGTITFNGGTNTTVYGTLYAANFSWPGNNNNVSLYPPPNQLGIYYTGSGTLTVGGNKFNVALEGAYIYAPNGTVQMYGNNGSGFIEAQAVIISGNGWTFAGAGPKEPGDYGDLLSQ
jgi:Flp pilus assembly protein TadG